jgi:hypothetical protein
LHVKQGHQYLGDGAIVAAVNIWTEVSGEQADGH